MTLIDVLDLTDEDLEFYGKVFNTFSGHHREWCVKTKGGGYSRRFMASNPEEFVGTVKSFAAGQPFEVHMSVQQFDRNLETLDWTFVIDIDGQDDEKEEKMKKVSALLDSFDVFYLVDNRYHIWIPDWEHAKVTNWNRLYGDNLFVESLATYLERVCRLPCGSIDRMLWKANRHTIRMPYSPHLVHGKQEFVKNSCDLNVSPLELWDGKVLDRAGSKNTLYYSKNFKTFIEEGAKLGQELLLLGESEGERCTEVVLSSTNWVERLLKTQIPVGYRGKLLWLVVTPYLVNVKKVSKQEGKNIVDEWLTLCKADKFKDRDLYNYFPSTYKHFERKGIMPCSLRRIKEAFPDIYKVLLDCKVVESGNN